MTDRQWCAVLLGRLHGKVAAETPEGLGAWPPAWDAVEHESAALTLELKRVAAGKGSRELAGRLALEVLVAWRRAAVKWRSQQ